MEASSYNLPLQQAKTSEWRPVCHPPTAEASVSTSSGTSTSFGSFSASIAAFTPPFEETEINTFTNSTSNTSAYNTGSSGSSCWNGSSHSTGNTPHALKHHYVGILHGAAPAVSLTSLGIPSTAVSVTDTSPAWAQHQFTTTTSGSSSGGGSGVSGCCTPLYCSLTPTPTPAPLHSGHSFLVKEAPSYPQQSGTFGGGGKPKNNKTAGADVGAAAAAAPVAPDAPTTVSGASPASRAAESDSRCVVSACAGSTRRHSSLLLNEQPLSLTSLPQEVQAALQQERGTPGSSSSVPDWFDVQTGCIKKELLPQLPSFRSTLNTSVAKLSAASRIHHRVRWPGESAKATAANVHHLHPRREAAPVPATGGTFPASGAPSSPPPAAGGPNAIMRRKSDSSAISLHSRVSPHMPLRSSSHTFAPESASANSPIAAFAVPTAGAPAGAATQPPRSRRVRFATVPSAREYRELSPFEGAAGASPSPPVASLRADLPHPCSTLTAYCQEAAETTVPAAEQQHTAIAGNPTTGAAGVYSRSSSLLNKMTEMMQRLLNYRPLQQHLQSRVRRNKQTHLVIFCFTCCRAPCVTEVLCS